MSVTWNRLERFSFSKFEIFSLARTWCLVFIITLDVALSELHSDLSVFLLKYEVSPVNIFLSPSLTRRARARARKCCNNYPE